MTQPLAGASPMRQLRAIRISLAIRDGLLAPGRVGSVVSVHGSAINVRQGPRILTIALDVVGGLPNGLNVPSVVHLDRTDVRSGMAVLTDGSSLSIPAASLAIGLSTATGWTPTMAALSQPSAGERSALAARALELGAANAPLIGLGPLLVALAGGFSRPATRLVETTVAALADLIEALQAGQAGRAVERAALLVGLGPGATPSGDDLLVGVAAGLLATAHPLAGPFAARLAASAAGRTTALAETYLWHAARGEFAERVQRTAAAVLSGDVIETGAAINDCMAWGASSGADLLVGMLVGIQADAADLPARLRATTGAATVAAATVAA